MCDALAVGGKPIFLMVHSNEYWLPKQAIRNIGKITKMLDIFWAEEPARCWDANGLLQGIQGTKEAVATN